MRAFLTLVLHDLRQHLTDRSVLIFALVIPLTLSAAFAWAFSGLDDPQLEPLTVAVSVPEGDQVAGVVPAVLEALPDQGIPVTVREAGAAEVPTLVDDGEAGVGIVVAEGFGQALSAGTGATVQIHEGPDAGLTGDVVTGIVQSTVRQMDDDSAAIAAASAQLSPEQLEQLTGELSAARPAAVMSTSAVRGQSLSPQAGIVAGQAGMFLFFTVGFAVLTLLTEREWGTLPRLRTMPLPRWLVPAAKATVGILLGVASTTVILLCGELLLDGVDLGSWPAVLVLVVATVVAATSVMALILRVARTSEQASLAMSVVAISLGVGGGTFFRLPSTGFVGQLLQINPVAALGRGLGITAGGGGVLDLAPVLLSLAVFAALTLLLARVMPGRKDAL